ncbi:MAG: FAD-dependent oxidoreductase, partial [Chloroflexi bacterium]|nr:FAD-dependent oxidoreductase [Chloroflexota bacterium]
MSEIVVIGAGPAGVAAAVTAAKAGAKVLLIDENGRSGGQYFKQPAPTLNIDQFPPSLANNIQRGRELLAGLNHPNITTRFDTAVWNITPERRLFLHGGTGEKEIAAKRLIIAAGAYERVMPFPGWTLPGVMTVGGAQLLLKSQGVLAGRKFLLAGTGPLLGLAGTQLLDAGAEITAVTELQSRTTFLTLLPRLVGNLAKLGQGLSHHRQLAAAGVPFKFGHTIVQALGQDGVTGAIIAKVDKQGRVQAGTEEELAVDTICLNYGFIPATELTRLLGCDQQYHAELGYLATVTDENMETSCKNIFAIGEVRGIGGVEVALLEGRIAGAAAARQLNYTVSEDASLQKEWKKAREVVNSMGSAFAIKPSLCELAGDDVLICRCEEVTAGEIRHAVDAGVRTLNRLKPWTRVGMGHCQGRICAPIIAQIA